MAKRDQIIQEAEKLVARGKLDAAIREYQRALELARQDTSTLNRLGDLLVKANRVDEAVEVYRSIAEHFADDGFFLKSIAIYKKMNRFSPQRTEIYERLADLYYKQGLAVEGRQQLVALAEWYSRAQETEEAARIYRRLAELEPTNLQVRGKLIDLLVQVGDGEGAIAEIGEVGESLLSRDLLDEAVKLYRRALDLGPTNGDFLAKCIDTLVERGRPEQAAELAAKALQCCSGGAELERAAGLALRAGGQFSQARKVLARLANREAGQTLDVLRAYGDVLIREGDVQAAKRALLPAVDRSIELRDRRGAASLVEILLESDEQDVEVLERATRVFDRREGPDRMRAVEVALADVYRRTGRRPEALQLYRRLAQEDPGKAEFAERIRELGGVGAGDAAAPAGGLEVAAPRLPVQGGTAEGAPGAENGAVAGGGEQVVDIDLTAEAWQASEEQDEARTVGPAAALEVPVGEEAPSGTADTTVEELYTEAVVFAKYGLADKAVEHLRNLLAIDATHGPARELLAGLGGEPEVVETARPAETAEAPVEAPPEPQAEGMPAASPAAAEESWAGGPEVPASSAAPSFAATRRIRLEDLEEALGVSRARRAKVTAPPPEPAEAGAVTFAPAVEAPAGPTFSSPVEWTPSPGGAPEVSSPADGGQPPEFTAPAESVEVLAEAAQDVELGDVLAGPDEERLREIDLCLQQGLLEEAGRSLASLREAYPEHPDVVSRRAVLKARGWDETGPLIGSEAASAEELFSEEEQFFDLAAELERELADEELVAEATGAGQEAEVSIEDLFKEFQRGVAEQVGEEDFDTHFNLGLAYREMGLYDEAIGEFQLAAKSGDYFVECCTMIAACYMDKGLPEQAFEWYERALKAPHLPPEAELGLRYEMGRSQEAAGNPDAALVYYAEVLAINPNFRDVVQRISILQA